MTHLYIGRVHLKKVALLIVILGLGLSVFAVNASGQSSTIPQWIRDNAKWWSQGAVSDSEYLQSIQYMISQGLIKIPVQQVIATGTPISQSDTAQTIVVRILADKEYTFYTFQKLTVIGQTIETGAKTPQSSFSAGQFSLESLPSPDKKIFYDLVSQYVNVGTRPNPFDVDIDIINGNGKTIETLEYTKCDPTAYFVYTNVDKDEYRLGTSDGPEIRDVTNFVCSGFRLDVK